MTAIAFLGLGNMGGPMSANLVAAGHAVRGFDPVPAATAAAAANGVDGIRQRRRRGGRGRRGHHHAAQRRLGQTLLRRDSARRASRARCSSTAPRSRSTTPARCTRWPSRTALPQLDAPVSGGVKGAVAGTLAFMVGGDESALQRARPVLEPMAGKIIHCGAAGAGQAAKVCNNMVLAVQQIAIGEAFVLAEKLGLSAQSLFDVITGATGNCWAVHTNCPVPGPVPTSPANNDFKPGFATALMNKDLGLAMDAVASTGSAAPLGSHAAEIYAKFAASTTPTRTSARSSRCCAATEVRSLDLSAQERGQLIGGRPLGGARLLVAEGLARPAELGLPQMRARRRAARPPTRDRDRWTGRWQPRDPKRGSARRWCASR